ncbi:MAG: short chain dehydrogenase, partial [Bacteroidota bacterium]
MKFQSLKNQIVLITGASSGIGFACAVLALKNGAKVVMLSRTISTKRNQFIELGFSEDDFLLLDVDVTEFDKVQAAV